MGVSLARVGSVLVLLGVAAMAGGFFLESISSYWEVTHFPQFSFGSQYRFYEQLGILSYFALASGVLLVGLGWALNQLGVSPSPPPAALPPAVRRNLGIALVLAGSMLITGWLVYFGALQEEAFSGVNPHLPIWFISLDGAFVGAGLAAWGIGWFLCRVS